MQAQRIPHEYVIKDTLCTFYRSVFSDHFFIFVRFQVLLFVQDSLCTFIVSLFRGRYTWVLDRSRAGGRFKSGSVFINFFPLGS